MIVLVKTIGSIDDLYGAPPQKRYRGVEVASHYLTMRDGTRIAVDTMLPKDRDPQSRLPTLMMMTRYWRSMSLRLPERPNTAPIGPREPIVDDLLARGFAIVVVDGRGSGASFGISRYPFNADEIADYGEVAVWAADQPWCSGKIGAFGISYEGATALRLASTGVPAVQAVMPQEIEFDVYPDVVMPGGIFNEYFMRAWHESNSKLDSSVPSSLFPWMARLVVKGVRPVDADRPARTLLAQALQAHQANTNVYQSARGITYRDDPFGETGVTLDDFSVFPRRAAIEASGASILNWASWLDSTTADAALRTHNTFANPQITIIGAWNHEMTAHGSPFLPPKRKPDPEVSNRWAAQAQFFERVLVRNEPVVGKTIFYYTLGAERWQQTDRFPPPNTEMQSWYFQADQGLACEQPAEVEAADVYTVDFAATTGTDNRWHTPMAKPLVYANRAQEDRRLLTYTSAPLEADLQVTGYPVVTLYVESSETDGAFFVYLEDVDPQGVVRYITEGQLRAIHRKLADDPAPYWAGMPYRTFKRADASPLPTAETVELTFGLQPTSVLFRRGHSIRIALAGADCDTFARVPAQAVPIWRISRSLTQPSRIQLPVMAGSSSGQ